MIEDIDLLFHVHERKVFEGLLKTPGDDFIPVFESQNCWLIMNRSFWDDGTIHLLAQCPILADSEGHKMDQLLFGLGRNFLLQHTVPKGCLKCKAADTCPDLSQT